MTGLILSIVVYVIFTAAVVLFHPSGREKRRFKTTVTFKAISPTISKATWLQKMKVRKIRKKIKKSAIGKIVAGLRYNEEQERIIKKRMMKKSP